MKENIVSKLLLLLGSFIIAASIGEITVPPYGWLFFGSSIILYALTKIFFDYLNKNYLQRK